MPGLDLACKVFIDTGDLVILEDPTVVSGQVT
jgi:DNA-binding transcriptional MocR family regulator